MAFTKLFVLSGLAIIAIGVADASAKFVRRGSGEALSETDPLGGAAMRGLIIEEFGWREIGGRAKRVVEDKAVGKPAENPETTAEPAASEPVGPPEFMREDHHWPAAVSLVTSEKPAIPLPSFARLLPTAPPILAFGFPAFLEDADVFAPPAAPQLAGPAASEVRQPVPVGAEIPRRIADFGEIRLPETGAFVAAKGREAALKRLGVTKPQKVIGVIVEKADASSIAAAVSFLETGFVPVGDAEGFEPDAALARLRVRRNEIQPGEAIKWLAPPRLYPKAGRASYCYIIASGEGAEPSGICEAWALGRHGAVMIVFAPDPALLSPQGTDATINMQNVALRWLDTIIFDAGEAYDDFDPHTDRVSALLAEDLIEKGQEAQTIAAIKVRMMFSGFRQRLPFFVAALAGALSVGLALLYLRRGRRARATHDETIGEAAATAPARSFIAPVMTWLHKYFPTLRALVRKPGAPESATPGSAASSPQRAERSGTDQKFDALEKYLPTAAALLKRLRGESDADGRGVRADAEAGEGSAILSERIAALRMRVAMEPVGYTPSAGLAADAPRPADRPGASVSRRDEPSSVGADTVTRERIDAAQPVDPAPEAVPPPAQPDSFAIEPQQDDAPDPTDAPAVSAIAPPPAEKPASTASPVEASSPANRAAEIDLIEPGDVDAARAILNARRQGNRPNS